MAKRQWEVNSNGDSSDKQGLKLLLVDENTRDLDYYSAVLRYLGYEVRSVDSYAGAATWLGREHFDLVIVDQGSSDFEGRSVLTRAVEIDRHVPVLVLTRTVDADCCIEALDSGAHEYVQKPLTRAEVQELVSDYVRPSPGVFPASWNYQPQPNPVVGNNRETGRESWRKAS